MAHLPLNFNEITSILLVELNRFGDVLHVLPAARAIKKAMPQAEITMLVEESNRHAVALEPLVDRVLTGSRTRTLRGFLRTVRMVRGTRYDLVCCLSPIRRNALLSFFARSRYRVGYLVVWRGGINFLRSTPVRARGFRLPFQTGYGSEHISHTAAKVCEALGIPVAEHTIQAPVETGESDLLPDKAYIIFHPFASWRYRAWPEDRSRAFLGLFLRSTTLGVVLIGERTEEPQIRDLIAGLSESHRVFVRVGLEARQLGVLILRAAAYVGVDSGPYQLCSLLGKQVVGIFGPTSPKMCGSLVSGSAEIYHRVECSPCLQKRCVREADPCMAMITPEEVLDRVRKLL